MDWLLADAHGASRGLRYCQLGPDPLRGSQDAAEKATRAYLSASGLRRPVTSAFLPPLGKDRTSNASRAWRNPDRGSDGPGVTASNPCSISRSRDAAAALRQIRLASKLDTEDKQELQGRASASARLVGIDAGQSGCWSSRYFSGNGPLWSLPFARRRCAYHPC